MNIAIFAAYRHPNLWFVSDGQQFKSRSEWLDDLSAQARHFKGSMASFQFGYPKDKEWWAKESPPPREVAL